MAVLEAIEEDGLQQHAHEVGTYLIQQLESLQKVRLFAFDIILFAMQMPPAQCLHSVLEKAPPCMSETSKHFMQTCVNKARHRSGLPESTGVLCCLGQHSPSLD